VAECNELQFDMSVIVMMRFELKRGRNLFIGGEKRTNKIKDEFLFKYVASSIEEY
jgi:hypothetical protein